MKQLTPQIRLSENEKDALFRFDTARGRFKNAVIKCAVMPALMIGVGLWMLIVPGLVAEPGNIPEWLVFALQKSPYLVFLLSLIAIPLGWIVSDPIQSYRNWIAAKTMMKTVGLDASQLSSADIWRMTISD